MSGELLHDVLEQNCDSKSLMASSMWYTFKYDADEPNIRKPVKVKEIIGKTSSKTR